MDLDTRRAAHRRRGTAVVGVVALTAADFVITGGHDTPIDFTT